MIEAVVIHWDETLQAGTATSTDGRSYELHYHDGQSFCTSDDYPLPRLNGKHEQSPGCQLKIPEVGDPVLIHAPSHGQAKPHWGYMRHYLELVERRYGTRFAIAL